MDAVSICAPSGLHADLGVRALRAGKHVVVEKPMDVSLAACDRLLAAQRESGKTLAVISQHRFDFASITVKDALDAGTLGPLVFAEARVPWYRTQEYYDSGDWRGTWALDGGGALMNQGVHTADLLRWLCGPVETVYAQARTLAHERIEVEDVVAATVTFANGAIATLSASTALYPGFAVRLSVHGTEGSAIIEGDRAAHAAHQDRRRDPGRGGSRSRPASGERGHQSGDGVRPVGDGRVRPRRPVGRGAPGAARRTSRAAAARARRRSWTAWRAARPWNWCWPCTSWRGRGKWSGCEEPPRLLRHT